MANILNGQAHEKKPDFIGAKVGSGLGSRDGSAGGRSSAGNMSVGSIGSMNVSAGGYGSDAGP